MANVLRWLGTAVKGLRAFAYKPPEGRLSIGLALGGGFARGIAHIGVLRVFQENDIPIDFLAGTSVGALVGAGYASGTTLDDLERIGAQTHFRDFGRWTISKFGMATNERLEGYLHRVSMARTFEELNIPFAIVATDIQRGESVYFTKGDLGPALRASCAFPGLFIPVEYEGKVLVDGFLTEVVPTEALRRMGADIVVAVHLDPGQLQERPRNTIEIIGRSFSIIQEQGQPRWNRFADVIIRPEVRNILWDDFKRTPQLVAAGAEAARAALPEIKAILQRPAPAWRRPRETVRSSSEA
jgi:NTE family protein